MAKKGASVGLVSPAAQWELLFASKHDFSDVAARPREEWFELLDNIGEDVVLETVASGRLPAEIALSNRIPLMVFREWFEERVNTDRLKVAARSHAEVAVLKSTLSLSAAPDSPADAAVQKELSARYAWIAERMDPERWGPPQKKDAAPPSVNIVFNMGKSAKAVAPGEDAKVINAGPAAIGAFPLVLNSKPVSSVTDVGADDDDSGPLPAGLTPRMTLEQAIAASRPYVEGV